MSETIRENKTILCIDDEIDILKSLERALSSSYTVIATTTANSALEILEEKEVDLIIADHRMPEMSGAELLTIVKTKYPNIIRIMLSGYTDFDGLVAAINDAEIFRFISKPWSNEKLLNLIDSAFEQTRILDSLTYLVNSVKGWGDVTKDLDISTSVKQNCIYLNIKDKEQNLSEQMTNKMVHFIFDSLGVDKENEINLLCGEISKNNGNLEITISIGKGVYLKICFSR